jgi:hypothetical protein
MVLCGEEVDEEEYRMKTVDLSKARLLNIEQISNVNPGRIKATRQVLAHLHFQRVPQPQNN